ncbi:tripartite tricarboxylate transporter substrate binding protein [Verticiella sediminum]|uniref:Tripartite tricarboxylate transporter substrate binding protein n=1 Tax=Verticiella sediminum TaxID=1247510 RepID=A0A556ANR6_9BURK|nr:tripartite tricarboxylate transporter substrate binding protein [Verticiella sediminum]TSH94527.1 tripartite tricarboxylate transporter substrate binding protein [Verticiella sediminum]
MFKRMLSVCTLACLTLGAASPALAQSAYPQRPVQLVVTSPPGSALDIFGRVLAQALGKLWGQTVYVDSRAGAGGTIAAAAVAKAPADGYTLFLINEQILVANRFTYRNLPYDPDTTFAPISRLIETDQLIVANQASGVKSLADVVELARADPQKLAYGMWSKGSSPNLVFEQLKQAAKVGILAVPYRGVGPVMLALQSDEVQLSVMSAPTGEPILSTGKAVPLAVASDRRSELYPDVPTTAELGYPQLRATTWYGLLARADTPAEILAKVERDVRAVLQDPGFMERNAELRGWRVVASSAEAFRASVAEQVPQIREMMLTAAITPE